MMKDSDHGPIHAQYLVISIFNKKDCFHIGIGHLVLLLGVYQENSVDVMATLVLKVRGSKQVILIYPFFLGQKCSEKDPV